MLARFSNFLRHTKSISMFVTPIDAIIEIIILRRSIMINMLAKINGLLTVAQQRTLRRAASILMLSDRHDEYFFSCCRELEGMDSGVHVVPIGKNYKLVHHQDVVTATVVEVRDTTTSNSR